MQRWASTAAVGGLLLAATAAGAQVYKGVDADGNVVYSSSPNVGASRERVEQIRIDPGPSDADRAAAERRVRALQSRTGARARQPTPGQPTPPAQQPSADSESGQTTEQQSSDSGQSYDWIKDESAARRGSSSRSTRGAGGFAGEGRRRGSPSLPSGRTTR